MRRTLIVAALALLAIPGSALAADTTRGTAGPDTLTGTADADAIFARAGDDTVDAGAGDDRVRGGHGDDTLNGEDGNDVVKGGGGEDTIDGGAGDDTIDARGDGRAADTITCGDGEDTVRAGREDEVADDCETVTQPGKPETTETPAPKEKPFAEDGKPGKGPKAAAATAEPTPEDLAAEACKTEKHDMGTQVFKRTYAAKSTAKAMRACVAKRVPAAEDDAQNAAQECKTERDADPAAFTEKYGTNKNKKNAYGKCVSGKAEDATEEETEARVNAAQTCKAMRADDKAAFEEEYGTKRNAFGKCVSATAKTGDDA